MTKTRVVVQRDKWGVGEEHGGYLYNLDGQYCILGFVCKALGIPDEDIRCRTTPSELVYTRPGYRDLLTTNGLVTLDDGFLDESEWVGTAINLNDSEVSPESREESLRRVFENTQFEVVFE